MANSGDRELLTLNLKDLFMRGRWRHVILLTYSFDLPFFEAYLLPILVQNGGRLITIAADAEWLAQRLPLWLERDQIREAGKRYMLCGVKVPGTFHPKIFLATNKTNGTALIGSGNMSPYGMSYGGELFTSVEWQDQQIPSLAQEIWSFYSTIGSSLSIDSYFIERVREMGKFVPGLVAPPKEHLLRHNLYEPLLNQVVREVASQQVADVFLWSPFTDEKLEALNALVNQLHPKRVTLALQPGITRIDGIRLQTIVTSHPQVEWRLAELLENASTAKHMIHAKGILITLASGEDILLAGSPNVSKPALLQTADHGNLETALLLRGQNIYHHLFEGCISMGGYVDFQALQWKSDLIPEAQTSKGTQVRLLGASLDGDQLALSIAGDCPPTTHVLLDNSTQLLPLLYRDTSFIVQVPTNEAPRIAKIAWNDAESNPVIIAHVKQLTDHAQESMPSRSISLATLIDGGDSEWILFLKELTEFAIIDPYDVVRAERGLPHTEKEEAEEAEHPLSSEDLNTIDFKSMVQRRLLLSGVSVVGEASYHAPASYWLDEITSYFKALFNQQQQRVIGPESTPDTEESTPDLVAPLLHAIQPMPVSKKLRTLLRNRIQRFINGLRTPAFYQKIPQEWIITNYIRFLNLFDLTWKRLMHNPKLTIFQANEHSSLCLELLSAFWGSDLEHGYWTSLHEDQMIEAGLKLIAYEADALTLASAYRILHSGGDAPRVGLFVIANIVRVIDPLDLFTVETAERALVYLDPLEYDPASLLQEIKNTQNYFSWDRYLQSLPRKYQLHQVALEDCGFSHGKTLVINTNQDVSTAPSVLAVFADWILVCAKHDPHRWVFQMYWSDRKDLLVYSRNSTKLMIRYSGEKDSRTLSTGIPPSEFGKWSSLPPKS